MGCHQEFSGRTMGCLCKNESGVSLPALWLKAGDHLPSCHLSWKRFREEAGSSQERTILCWEFKAFLQGSPEQQVEVYLCSHSEGWALSWKGTCPLLPGVRSAWGGVGTGKSRFFHQGTEAGSSWEYVMCVMLYDRRDVRVCACACGCAYVHMCVHLPVCALLFVCCVHVHVCAVCACMRVCGQASLTGEWNTVLL